MTTQLTIEYLMTSVEYLGTGVGPQSRPFQSGGSGQSKGTKGGENSWLRQGELLRKKKHWPSSHGISRPRLRIYWHRTATSTASTRRCDLQGPLCATRSAGRRAFAGGSLVEDQHVRLRVIGHDPVQSCTYSWFSIVSPDCSRPCC